MLFPDWSGLDRESSEHPIAVPRANGATTTQQQWPLDENGQPRPSSPPPAETASPTGSQPPGPSRPGLPTCGASLLAGRAVSDCVFNREQGGPFADELDVPFGAFLAALGGNWSVLRELEDLDVWLEAADNVLETLSLSEQHVRFWYEIGFQLATFINLAGRELDGGPPRQRRCRSSGVAPGRHCAFLRSTPGSSRPPSRRCTACWRTCAAPGARDYGNLARVQERMRELANRRDASGLAASA